MPRISCNLCNVLTGEDSNAYVIPGREPAPEITIPQFRVRFGIGEAKALVESLQNAIAVAEDIEVRNAKAGGN